MKSEEFFNELIRRGLAESRDAAVVANAVSLPNGEWGLCLLCVNNGHLQVLDTDMHQNIGTELYDIELAKISDFKSSSFVLGSFIKFTYNGFRYHFNNFGNAKKFIDLINNSKLNS